MAASTSLSFGPAWAAVDTGLAAAAPLWRDEPFRYAASSLQPLGALEEGIADGACLRSVIPGLDALLEAAGALEPEECELPFGTPSAGRRGSGVPGRKWAQAEAFAALLPPADGPLVDWCSGKGHLARSLCHRGCCSSAHCLEVDSALCDAGAALSRTLPVDFTAVDVLASETPLPGRLRGPAFAHSALHACGDLHRRALTTARDEHARLIAVVPCCYHKLGPERYQPLSHRVAETSRLLPLPTAALRLATAETVTARARDVERRAREQRWRLAIDAWQREVRGVDEYLCAPSATGHLTSNSGRDGFHAFCDHWATAAGENMVERAGLAHALTAMTANAAACDHFLARGETARLRVQRLEAVRQCYRRPLELWLCADLALCLEETGEYDVALRRLCTRDVTPRNVMVLATRRDERGTKIL
jgi:hypothetical protein